MGRIRAFHRFGWLMLLDVHARYVSFANAWYCSSGPVRTATGVTAAWPMPGAKVMLRIAMASITEILPGRPKSDRVVPRSLLIVSPLVSLSRRDPRLNTDQPSRTKSRAGENAYSSMRAAGSQWRRNPLLLVRP